MFAEACKREREWAQTHQITSDEVTVGGFQKWMNQVEYITGQRHVVVPMGDLYPRVYDVRGYFPLVPFGEVLWLRQMVYRMSQNELLDRRFHYLFEHVTEEVANIVLRVRVILAPVWERQQKQQRPDSKWTRSFHITAQVLNSVSHMPLAGRVPRDVESQTEWRSNAKQNIQLSQLGALLFAQLNMRTMCDMGYVLLACISLEIPIFVLADTEDARLYVGLHKMWPTMAWIPLGPLVYELNKEAEEACRHDPDIMAMRLRPAQLVREFYRHDFLWDVQLLRRALEKQHVPPTTSSRPPPAPPRHATSPYRGGASGSRSHSHSPSPSSKRPGTAPPAPPPVQRPTPPMPPVPPPPPRRIPKKRGIY